MESASEHSSRLRELRRLPASSRVKTTTRADGQQATGAGSASGEPSGRDLLATWPGRGAAHLAKSTADAGDAAYETETSLAAVAHADWWRLGVSEVPPALRSGQQPAAPRRSYTVAVGVPLVEPGPGWGAPRKPVPQEGLGPCENDAQASVTRVSSRSAHSPQNEALQDALATLRARVSELEESNARLEKANHLVQQEKQSVQTEKDELARHNTELQSKLSALVCIPMKPKNYGVCGTVHVSLTGVKFENTCTPEYLRRDVACLLGRHRGYVCVCVRAS